MTDPFVLHSDTLYACFETSGQRYVLYQFALPEGGARLLPESSVSACMTCGRSFGILGKAPC